MTIPWRGVFPAMTTQFRRDESLDLEATCRHIETMIASGAEGKGSLPTVGAVGGVEGQDQGLDIGHATEAKASRRVRVKRRGSPFARGEGRPSAADAPSELDLRSELTENPTPKEWRRGR